MPADPNPSHPASIEFGDRKTVATDLHRLTQFGEVTKLCHQEPSHCLVGTLGQYNPCLLCKIVGIQQPVDDHVAAAQAIQATSVEVVLIANITDDLLDEILECHDARRPTVFVDDNRQVLPLAPHLRQGCEHVL